MKKKHQKQSYSLYDILGIIILVAVISFAGYFSYGLINSYLDEDQNVTSNQVWCNNCQTYHDKETAEAEAQSKELVWCVNCKKYHAPGLD